MNKTLLNCMNIALMTFMCLGFNACGGDDDNDPIPSQQNDNQGGNGTGNTDSASGMEVAQAVDLGLPSGTKWASWNMGASAPEENGNRYSWGEVEPKEFYTQNTYTLGDLWKSYMGRNIQGTSYDVAHVKWGGNWVMPTIEQIKELGGNCDRRVGTKNGVDGVYFIGPNANSIFMPFDPDFEGSAKTTFYWSCSVDKFWDNDLNEHKGPLTLVIYNAAFPSDILGVLNGWGGRFVRAVTK